MVLQWVGEGREDEWVGLEKKIGGWRVVGGVGGKGGGSSWITESERWNLLQHSWWNILSSIEQLLSHSSATLTRKRALSTLLPCRITSNHPPWPSPPPSPLLLSLLLPLLLQPQRYSKRLQVRPPQKSHSSNRNTFVEPYLNVSKEWIHLNSYQNVLKRFKCTN